ncbi:hypothetical protein LTS10_003338 [Elasticomyces elasticus]|nr:hypothetical protein LTS10_003338 [Elasticomyces elasticus]
MAPPNDVVLVTGGTGFIGFATLKKALEDGYTVRAAVRSEAKADNLRTNPSIKKFASNFSFVVVPDILAPHAFDEAVKGVKYILHLASPLTTGISLEDDLDAHVIQPAVRGTLEVLESAAKEASVKRIVICSSIVAIVPVETLTGAKAPDHAFRPEERAHDVPGPYPAVIVAYVQSKIAALKEAEAWVEKEKPSFDVIHIHPSFVGGRNDLARNLEELKTGTNFYFLAPVLGQEAATAAGPRVASYVDVDDVAKAHVLSLDDKVAGNQSFMLSGEGDMAWDGAKVIAAKHFPDAVGKVFPNDGESAPFPFSVPADNSKTVKTFGKLRTYEETVKAVVGQYIELSQQAA